MSERLNKRNISAFLTASLATVAFFGCGDEQFKGSKKIPNCAKATEWAGHPVSGFLEPNGALYAAQETLRYEVTANEPDNTTISILDIPSGYEAAVDAAFGIQDDAANLTGEHRLDDPSEIFCYGLETEGLYFSPAAQDAIRELDKVGIEVNAPLAGE